MAYLSTSPDFNPPDERFVMTTWHENETIPDVLSSALNSTDFDSHSFKKYLALVIGKNASVVDAIHSAIVSQLNDPNDG